MTDPIDRMPEARRAALVHAAAEEFASRGFEAASLNRVLQRCSMSKSSFYHVVSSKLALFDLAAGDLAARVVGGLGAPDPAALTATSYWQEVEAIATRLEAVLGSDPAYLSLGRMLHAAPEGSEVLAAALPALRGWLEALAARGAQLGLVRDDVPSSALAELLLAMLWALDGWAVDPGRDGSGDVAIVADLVRRVLEPGASQMRA